MRNSDRVRNLMNNAVYALEEAHHNLETLVVEEDYEFDNELEQLNVVIEIVYDQIPPETDWRGQGVVL